MKTERRLSLGLVSSYIPCKEKPGELDNEPGWGFAGMGFPRLTSKEFLTIDYDLANKSNQVDRAVLND